MTAFFLPGMFAPKIHDSAFGNSVMFAISLQVAVQPFSASGVGSTVRTPLRSALPISPLIHSTWGSMLGGRLVNGPFGPRIMNMFGKPDFDRPT
jgi:hypothetical protein